MAQYSFQDFRNRIKIQDLAASLGYWVNTGAGTKQLSMCLGDRKAPTDEIIIYNYNDSGQSTYFSRKGSLSDKGNLINFVQARLKELGSTKDGIAGVNEVLNKYLNNELDIKKVVVNSTPVQMYTFNIKYWWPNKIEDSSIQYLHQRRQLSLKTISDFSDRCHIYTVGKNKHVGFPFRIPGQMEICNYEMRNFFPENNRNYKGFCSGGDKTKSCWIANFCEYNKVTDIYLFESAIDAMSFYELKGFTKETTSALVSLGGHVTNTQIASLLKIFPHVKYHLCFDNDLPGKSYDVVTTYAMSNTVVKAHMNKEDLTIVIDFGTRKETYDETFNSREYLQNFSNIDIIKPQRGKDWNEELTSYKRFGLNLQPHKDITSALDKYCSKLNLSGYTNITDIIDQKRDIILESLSSRQQYELKNMKLASTPCKDLNVDINISYKRGEISYALNNVQITDITTQVRYPANSLFSYFEDKNTDILKKLSKPNLEDLLKKKEIVFDSQRVGLVFMPTPTIKAITSGSETFIKIQTNEL